MQKLQVAVCDDEKTIGAWIESRVHSIYPKAGISIFTSGEELLLSDKHIDILFLDIQMPGINGMETARKLRGNGKKMILIFLTAIEDYVFEAFDVGAFHYLVKPVDGIRFAEVLKKAVDELHSQDTKGNGPETDYVMINNGGVHTKVRLDEIVYAEVFNRKVVIHKMDSKIEYYGKMSDLEAKAGDGFFRPHRAYLINFRYVEKYDAATIYLEKGTALMAKQKYPEFVKRYMKYNQRKGK